MRIFGILLGHLILYTWFAIAIRAEVRIKDVGARGERA